MKSHYTKNMELKNNELIKFKAKFKEMELIVEELAT